VSRIVVLLLVQAAAVAFAARAPGNGTGRIALAPIGEVRTEEISTLRQPLKAAFGVEVVLVPRLPLPSSAYDRERGQYRSTILLDALARARQPEWERLVGVTQVDLYVPELNFVFGEGDSRGGVAVFSLARLRCPDEALWQRRAATEAIHELGHTYGLSHCDDPHCVMWFSNTLSETDRKGIAFCRLHRAQLTAARQRISRP
jgi:archaemetzincin